MKILQRKATPGFTIIELMIVLVIVGILLALAYPSFMNYTRKAKRGEAQQALMNWSINQEIFRSNNPAYAPDTSIVLPKPIHQDGLYAFEAHGAMGTEASCTGGSGDPGAAAYWLDATAQGDQANDVARNGDSCATLCLSSSGVKQPAACWD
jgi:type IV pilus assembly protein PilE